MKDGEIIETGEAKKILIFKEEYTKLLVDAFLNFNHFL